MGHRHLSAAGLSIGMTFALLFVMQALVAIDDVTVGAPSTGFIVDFTRLIEEEPVQEKERRPTPPKPMETPPPIQDFQLPRTNGENVIEIIEPVPTDTFVADGGVGLDHDTDAAPRMRILPTYPATLAARGIEGWVELEFTITPAGTVSRPRVVASSHRGFEKSALKAIRGWRYAPRVEDGRPVSRHGIRVRLAFDLDQAAA